MSLTTVNDFILAKPEVFELQKTMRAGLAAPLVKSVRPLKVAVSHKSKNLSLEVGDEIYVVDDVMRKSQNLVKVIVDGKEVELLMVKEGDIVGIRRQS